MKKLFQIFEVLPKKLLEENKNYFSREKTSVVYVDVLDAIASFDTEEECITHLENIEKRCYVNNSDYADFIILPVYKLKNKLK